MKLICLLTLVSLISTKLRDYHIPLSENSENLFVGVNFYEGGVWLRLSTELAINYIVFPILDEFVNTFYMWKNICFVPFEKIAKDTRQSTFKLPRDLLGVRIFIGKDDTINLGLLFGLPNEIPFQLPNKKMASHYYEYYTDRREWMLRLELGYKTHDLSDPQNNFFDFTQELVRETNVYYTIKENKEDVEEEDVNIYLSNECFIFTHIAEVAYKNLESKYIYDERCSYNVEADKQIGPVFIHIDNIDVLELIKYTDGDMQLTLKLKHNVIGHFDIDINRDYFNLLCKIYEKHEKLGVYHLITGITFDSMHPTSSNVFTQVLFNKDNIVLEYKANRVPEKIKRLCNRFYNGFKCILFYKGKKTLKNQLSISDIQVYRTATGVVQTICLNDDVDGKKEFLAYIKLSLDKESNDNLSQGLRLLDTENNGLNITYHSSKRRQYKKTPLF
jgi:hypothetical protein